MIHQALEDAPEGIAGEISVREEISDFADQCQDKAREYRNAEEKQAAGYWLRIILKIRKAIDDEDNGLKIAYGEALRLAIAFDVAVPLLEEVLQVLEDKDMEDEESGDEEMDDEDVERRFLAGEINVDSDDDDSEFFLNIKLRLEIMKQLMFVAIYFHRPLEVVNWLNRIVRLDV